MPLLLLLILAATPTPAKEFLPISSPDGLVLVFRASPVANLAYQLNCLAGIGSCTKSVYKKLWSPWTKKDAQALARWSALMTKRDQDDGPNTDPPTTPLPIHLETLGPLNKLRIAAYGAETQAAYAQNLAKLLAPEDAKEALAITARFQPRFDRWWNAEGQSRAEASAQDLRALIIAKDLPAFYAKAARFYGYEYSPGTTVEFDVMAQPGEALGHSNGEQVGDHSVIEVMPGENAEDRIDVVSHELFHYFDHSAPASRRVALLQAFADAPEPDALAAYGLLGESLATALGQGLVSRMILPPEKFARLVAMKESFYADPIIDGAAKSLIAPLDRMLAGGVTIGQPAFREEYLKAVDAGLGPRLSSPRAWFRNVGLAWSRELKASQSRFSELMNSNSSWSYSSDETGAPKLFEDHPALSGALFLTPGDLGVLDRWSKVIGEKDVDSIRALAKTRESFVYGVRRSEKAYVYVFVGPDARSVSKLVAKFAAAPAMFAGLGG